MKIIYSNRKTISLSVNENLEIIVRANKTTSKKFINEFVLKNEPWIAKQKKKIAENNANKVILSDNEILKVKADAKIYIKSRVEHFEKIMGVKSTSFKITSAKTRFGSCSSLDGLCFSYKTMLLPPDLIDYIVVHELAHILQKNHSSKFYAEVEKYLPDYKERILHLRQIERRI